MRRRFGTRSLMVASMVVLFAAVPALAPGADARAEARAEGRAGEAAGIASILLQPPARHAAVKTKRQAQQRTQKRVKRHANRHVKRPPAGIVLDIDAPNAPILPGKTYNWPFSVTNRGADKVEHVTFAAPLSKHLDFVNGQDDCAWQRGMAVCELGAMKHGQTKTGVLTAKVDPDACEGDTIGGTGLVNWGSPSDHGRVETAFPAVKVVEAADLAVIGKAPPQVQPGGEVPYEVTVFNRGTTTAEHVMVRQMIRTVHESVAVARPLFTVTDPSGPCEPQRTGIVCDLGSLKSGESRKVRMNVLLNQAAKPGLLLNAPAQVTSPTIDANEANNDCSPETKVVPEIPMRTAIPARGPGHGAPDEGPGRGAPHHGPGDGLPGSPDEPGTPAGHGAPDTPPGKAGGLPHTGAQTRLFAGLALGLVGGGLVLMGLSRRRRRSH